MTEEKIIVRGLTKFDCLDLGKGKGIEYEEDDLEAGHHGEVSVFTAVLTMALVSTLAAFLLRKHQGQSFEEEVEILHPDGRIEKRRVKWEAKSSEAPEAELIRQIRGGTL